MPTPEIRFMKKINSEPDRGKRKIMIRAEYERMSMVGDALIATMSNFGMTSDEIYQAFKRSYKGLPYN